MIYAKIKQRLFHIRLFLEQASASLASLALVIN